MHINEKNFCTSPFTEVRINVDGSYNFCYAARNNELEKTEYIQNQHIDYYFNKSNTIQSVREGLLNGVPHSRCDRCLFAELKSPTHYRQIRNINFGIFPGKDFEQSFNESNILSIIENKDKKPYFYHVSLGNLCNLGCIMCSPFFSSHLGKLMKKAGVSSDHFEYDKDAPILHDWTKNKTIWEGFLNHILSNKNIVSFHFMGGEPLYHKKFYEFIDFCVDNNHTDFHISFVSNATIVPTEEYINKLKKFRSVHIEISIENLDLSNDYVRYPSSYIDIEKNMKKYVGFSDNHFSLIVRTVPQFLTLFAYHKLLDWCLENKVCIECNIIDSPKFFTPNLLPDSNKKDIISKLSKYIINDEDVNLLKTRDAKNFESTISKTAKTVLNSLNFPSHDTEALNKQAVEYCARLDRARKIHIKNFIPDIFPVFERYDYEKLIG